MPSAKKLRAHRAQSYKNNLELRITDYELVASR